jgi:hypothetical protein
MDDFQIFPFPLYLQATIPAQDDRFLPLNPFIYLFCTEPNVREVVHVLCRRQLERLSEEM